MGLSVVEFDLQTLDLSDLQKIRSALNKHKPHYLVNCASYSAIDLAEANPDQSYRINRDATANMASACADAHIPLLHLSTDHVFDGCSKHAINEQTVPNPINIYGRSKLAGEVFIRDICPQHIILRASWVFSDQGNNFVTRTLRQIQTQTTIKAVDDQQGCPTYANDVALALLAIIKQVDCGIHVWGTYHYSGAEVVTWKGFAGAILTAVKQHPHTAAKNIVSVSSAEWPMLAPRPHFSVLDCRKILATFGIRQRPWRSGLVKVIQRLAAVE
jgi:dTDP-4-dehydrorhamnose reductase